MKESHHSSVLYGIVWAGWCWQYRRSGYGNCCWWTRRSILDGCYGISRGASAFIESTLAQLYKEKADDQYRGGSPYYIEKGLRLKGFAIFVAIVICLSYGVLVPGIQANTIATSFNTAFHIPPFITGALIVILLGLIIFGGVKRIARVADKVVPIMALAYVILTLIILGANVSEIPDMVKLILTSAFGTNAILEV